MTTSPARPLIITCGAFMALFDLVALLPGNPVVTSAGGFLVVVAVQVLLIWRILHRSLIAWSLTIIFSGLYTVSTVLLGGPYETTLIVTSLFTLMQVGLLCTPPVLAYVFGDDNAVTSH